MPDVSPVTELRSAPLAPQGTLRVPSSGAIERGIFTALDYLRIPFRPEEAHLAAYADVLAARLEQTDAYTWCVDDGDGPKPVACGGIMVVWPGVGEGWFRCQAGLHPTLWRSLVRQMRDFILTEHIPALGLRRFQVVVSVDFSEAHAWAQFLGMYPEALLRRSGPLGEDQVLYVRFFDNELSLVRAKGNN